MISDVPQGLLEDVGKWNWPLVVKYGRIQDQAGYDLMYYECNDEADLRAAQMLVGLANKVVCR